MVKESNQVLTGIMILVVIFSALYFLNTGDLKMKAIVIDENNEVSLEQDINERKSIEYTQSFLDTGFLLSKTVMQSFQPLGEEDKYVNLEVNVRNPFDKEAQLKFLDIYANNNFIESQSFVGKFVAANDVIGITAKDLDIKGELGRNNIISLKFIFESGGKTATQEFEFSYLYLLECQSDSDCKSPATRCDLGNLARFSTKEYVHYCAVPCQTSASCFDGQICIKGVCGY